jgi:hypothetical protein
LGDCSNTFSIKKYEDSSFFEGLFQNGKKHCGIYYYNSGSIYKGNFEDNKKEGEGLFLYNNQDTFQGIFKNDDKFFGTYKYKNGDIFNGYFKNDKPHGYGTLKIHDGKIYDCIWNNGEIVSKNIYQIQRDSSLIEETWKSIDNLDDERKNYKPRMFALIVGVSRYEKINNLKYADDDAILVYNNFKDAFTNETDRGEIVLLTNEQATSRAVISRMKDIFSKANDNDFIVFYFSGHGSQGAFCSYDGLIDHFDVRNIIVNSKSKYKLCIADACFSGSISNTHIVAGYDNLHDERMGILMSSKSNQASIEYSGINHGIFSYYFVKGMHGKGDLNKDKYVTVGELFLYVKKMVSKDSEYRQIPIIFGNDLNKIPLSRIK